MFFSTIACSILIVILTPLITWYWNIWKMRCFRNVPGPQPIPLLGNTNLLGNNPCEYLQGLLRLQNRYGNVYKLWTGSTLRLMVNKPEYLEKLLMSNVNVSKSNGYDLFRPWLGDGLLVSAGSKWRLRRKMITPTFHFKVLEDFMEIFNRQIDIMLDQVQEAVAETTSVLDMGEYLNLMTLDIICETAFGTPIGAQTKKNPDYVKAVKDFLEIFVYRFYSGWMRYDIFFRFSSKYQEYKKTLKILHEFCDDIIQKRRKEFRQHGKMSDNREDGIKIRSALLDMLLENDVNLTDDEIKDEVNTFMFEGHDTSSTVICFTLYALAQNPEPQQKVFEELLEVFGTDPKSASTLSKINDLHYMDLVVKEAMRLYQPVPLIERNIDEEWIVDGIKVPKDTTVTIFLYGMAHDPTVFEQPDKFEPERFLPVNVKDRHNFAYVPFSAGPRNCIGQKYALYSLKACLAKFLLQFRVELVPGFELKIGTCSVLKSLNGYKMKLHPRC